MHLLFLSWWWPYPANNGSKIRIYNLLKHLSLTHEVTLLSFAEANEATSDQIQHLRGFCAHVGALPKPHYDSGTLKATLGYLSRWPRSLVDVYSPVMAKRVQAVAHHCDVDVVIASQLQTMRYLELLPETPAILEEAEITAFHDRVKRSSPGPGRFRAQLTLTKLENALRILLERGVSFTVVSAVEQQHMRQLALAQARIEIIPNGVDTTANRPDPTAAPQPHSLIYTGAVTYDANYDAVAYFIQDIFPLVRARLPDARFTVTGGTGSVDAHDLAAQPGVTFSGYLASVAPAVQQSWAMVAPLRVGGGTRLKILEAMALGTPVISTAKGAEGLNLRPGHDFLLADTPQEMAETICRLFADADLRQQLAANGRARVERDYAWSAIAARLNSLIDMAVADKVNSFA